MLILVDGFFISAELRVALKTKTCSLQLTLENGGGGLMRFFKDKAEANRSMLLASSRKHKEL